MKKFYFLLSLIFSFSLIGFAQTPSPTATPSTVGNDDVVKISTDLIQVDVTVIDKNGKVVPDLKPQDFEVYENGKKQDITNFSFISAKTETNPNVKVQKPAVKSDSSVSIPPVAIKPEQVRRTIAIAVDDLGLSLVSINFVKKSLKKFVDEQMQPNDLVAIIRTGSGIGALQQFTSDKRLLYAAIDKINWNPAGREGLTSQTRIDSPAPGARELKLGAPVNAPPAHPTDDDAKLKGLRDPDKEAENSHNAFLTNATLNALSYIVKGMKELPGRKSLLLFSDGFRLFDRGIVGNEAETSVWQPMQKLIDSATRSAVVIYSMDTKGLEALDITAADGASVAITDKAVAERRDDYKDKRDGITYLAKETGGQAFVDTNDLNMSIEKALVQQKEFYLLGYQPDAETFDPKTLRFNKLEIKVSRPDVKVSYRSGFLGVSDEKNLAVNQTPKQQILKALNSPFSANDINLRLNTLFGNDTKDGSYVRSLLHIEAKDLKFSNETNGTHKATFDVLAVSYGDNGVVVDQIQKNYTLTVKENIYRDILNEGFVYEFLFPVKTPGAYQMRVAVLDQASAKVGSASQFIEVPDLKKDNLVLSGVVLENLSEQNWRNSQATSTVNASLNKTETNPTADTSLRRFKQGTVLRYGVEIYNAKLDQARKPQIQTQIKIFRDGKLILEGSPKPFNAEGQTNLQKINYVGALELGKALPKGEYVLQLIVIDNQAKEKNKSAAQLVQFEITD